MPGFKLGEAGLNNDDLASTSGTPTSMVPIYTYAWTVDEMFGEGVEGRKDPIYLRDCELPKYVMGSEDYESASIKLKYAGRVDWGDVKVSFYDTMWIWPTIKAWQEKMWDHKGGLKVAADYKSTSRITLYDPADENINTFVLHGSWPQSIAYANLTYTNSDIHSIDVTIRYDWATIG